MTENEREPEKFKGLSANYIIRTIANVFNKFIHSDLNPLPGTQFGVYFSIQDGQEDLIWVTKRIGYFIDPEFGKGCYELSAEKAERVIRNFKAEGHILSFQSQETDQRKFAGGVISPDSLLALGISGLRSGKNTPYPGHDDDAVASVSMIALEWVDNVTDWVETIERISSNTAIRPLFDLVFKV